MEKSKKEGMLFAKDMEKAYGHVDWDCIKYIVGSRLHGIWRVMEKMDSVFLHHLSLFWLMVLLPHLVLHEG